MRAIAIDGFGGSDELTLHDLEDPKVGPDSVLIRVRAAGVNPVDFKIREGRLEAAFPHRFPLVPGWDAAGTVEAVGPAVTDLTIGDEVYAYCRKTEISEGAYAELVSVPQTHVARKPERASMVAAAGVPLAALTAWQCVSEKLALRDGQTVLVTAAAGGVGHFAVQLARSLGAEVIGTASEVNHDFVRSLGADAVIDYGDGDVGAQVRDRHPDGVDAVVDLYGGAVLTDASGALRNGGQVVSIADPDPTGGAEDITGHYVFVRPDGAQLGELARLYDDGRLTTEVAEAFPLAGAAAAHDRLEEGHVRGKLVLEV